MMFRHLIVVQLALAISCIGTLPSMAQYPVAPQITDKNAPGAIAVKLEDWATLPKSGTSATSQVARINFVRSEPVAGLASTRLFANDLNGNLYIMDRDTGTFSSYLNFGATFSGQFDTSPGYAAGVVTFAFDPDYANNGKFYTVHTELGSNPSAFREAVLYEWRDTNINNTTFQGTCAELLRVQYTGNAHPIGDIVFNPTAKPGDADWRNMYISSGDGTAGASSSASVRNQPQMLNNFLGKVLRIQPGAAGTPGTYSIPSDNPFVGTANARGEIYAYGFRNPHRLSWDVDPQNPADNHLFVTDIGQHSWEEVNIVKAGGNYGYSRLEGNMVMGTNNLVNSTPLPSTLPIIVNDPSAPVGNIAPTYPVAQYSHLDGDAISSGFVYRGTLIPELQGKFVFGDITTARLFYTDLSALLAADDGNPATMATIHELKIFYDSPYDADGLTERRIFDIVRDTFDRRNETPLGAILHSTTADGDILPGSAEVTDGNDPYGIPYGSGRADIRLALIDNELYLLSKSDGMLRALVSVPEPSGIVLFIAMATILACRLRPWRNGASGWLKGEN